MKTHQLRKLVNKIHLWIGLTLSLFIFILTYSGLVLIFEKEIKSLSLNSSSSINHPAPSLDGLVNKVDEWQLGKILSIATHTSNTPIELRVAKNEEDKKGQLILIDPVRLEVIKESTALNNFFSFHFKLHRWLLFPTEIGRPIVGVITIGFIFLILSGLYLWIPKNKNHFKKSLYVKLNSPFKKLNYDLHNTLGFYASIFLFILAITGLCWSFEWHRATLSSLVGGQIFEARGQKPKKINESEEERKSLDELAIIAHINMPQAGTLRITLPSSADEALVFSKTNESDFTVRGVDRLELNPHTGEIVHFEKFIDYSFGKKLASLNKAIHMGDFFGLTSKIFYFFISIIGMSLPITGFFIWYGKLVRQQKMTQEANT